MSTCAVTKRTYKTLSYVFCESTYRPVGEQAVPLRSSLQHEEKKKTSALEKDVR
jgi:hypothetical protein